MKRALHAAVVLAMVAVAVPARAQLAVVDVPTELNTLFTYGQAAAQVVNSAKQVDQGVQEILQLTNTVNAIVHGNGYQVGQLVPELSQAGLMNPVTNLSPELNQMFTGTTLGSGAVGSLAGQILGQTQIYAPPGADWRAQMIQARAVSAATQMAAASVMYDGTQGRLNVLPQLGTAIGGSVDIKDAMDANARLAHEQLVQSAHANQLATLLMMQRAQADVREAQEEEAWRCSADQFVANAAAAAQAAGAGTVQLVSAGGGATACASAPGNVSTGIGGSVVSAGGGTTDPSASNPFDGAGTSDPSSGGVPNPTAPGTSDPSGGVTTASYGTSATDPTSTMTAQPWGQQVASNATAMGVNPTEVAAVCVIESNCQNVAGTGTVSGPFQMTNGTYNSDIAQAAQENPSLASQIGDKSDPTTEGIAASQELKNDAAALQANDVANPTGLDVRGEYQFGPKYGAAIATANDSDMMTTVLQGTSASTLAVNGITSTETVGQWRAGVAAKLGTAANKPVLLNQNT